MSDLPQPNSTIRVGQLLRGKYRVERILGAGGMGTVVAATHLRLDQPVAIKLLHLALLQKPVIVARFAREARAAAKLKSEHAIRILDVDDSDEGEPFLVMELLEGEDLASVVARGPLPVATAVEHVLQACVAVAEAHARGIVHRDLKPANLFLTTGANGRPLVKLLDFGISKAQEADEGHELSLTGTTGFVGSPYFMSPEQLRSAKDVDARTDLWSLGVVLYELVTGALPFTATNATSLAARIAADPPLPIARAEAPDGLRDVIMRCLEKDPNKRIANATELARALAPFGGDTGADWVLRVERAAQSPTTAPGPITGTSEPKPRVAAGASGRRTESLGDGALDATELAPLDPNHDVSSAVRPPPVTTEYGSVGAVAPAPARASIAQRWAPAGIVAALLIAAWAFTRAGEGPRGLAAPDAASVTVTATPILSSPASVGSAPAAVTIVAATAPLVASAPDAGARLEPTRRPKTSPVGSVAAPSSAPSATKDPLHIEIK